MMPCTSAAVSAYCREEESEKEHPRGDYRMFEGVVMSSTFLFFVALLQGAMQ